MGGGHVVCTIASTRANAQAHARSRILSYTHARSLAHIMICTRTRIPTTNARARARACVPVCDKGACAHVRAQSGFLRATAVAVPAIVEAIAALPCPAQQHPEQRGAAAARGAL